MQMNRGSANAPISCGMMRAGRTVEATQFWFAAKAELEREEGTEEANLSAHVPPHVEPSRDELSADRGKRQSNSRL